ncbi:MAG: hypothetical protein PHP64_08665, partial [Actinomycetota bacterium]|nr:hypothetical protein [Actinomycetota bacterium]
MDGSAIECNLYLWDGALRGEGLLTDHRYDNICVHMCYAMHMKLSEWAKKNGITYRTALRWYH